MRYYVVLITCLLAPGHCAMAQPARSIDWPRVGNDSGCTRYSPLDQINRQSVKRLKPRWTYHTRELEGRAGKTIECTPIVIDGVMYVTTGSLRVVALDAAIPARSLWQFDPLKDHPFSAPSGVRGCQNRGVAYWSDGKPNGQAAGSFHFGTADGRLFWLDACRAASLRRKILATAGSEIFATTS